MTDLRDRLLARLDDLLATCGAATPGPWEADANAVRDAEDFALALTSRVPNHRNAAYIAAHNPSVLRPVWREIRWMVVAHTEWEGACVRTSCRSLYPETYPCLFLREWAERLGVTADEPTSEVTG